MLQSVGICVIFKISAEPQTVVYSLKTIFMSKFIASPGVSVTLHSVTSSPHLWNLLSKNLHKSGTVKSHTNVCSCRLKAKVCFCASFFWALRKRLSVLDGGSVLKSLLHFIS